MNNQFETWWSNHEGSKVQPPIMSQALKELAQSAWDAAKNNSTGNILIATMTLSELATRANLNDEYFNHVNVFLVNTKTKVIGYVYNEARFTVIEDDGRCMCIDLYKNGNMKMEVEIFGK